MLLQSRRRSGHHGQEGEGHHEQGTQEEGEQGRSSEPGAASPRPLASPPVLISVTELGDGRKASYIICKSLKGPSFKPITLGELCIVQNKDLRKNALLLPESRVQGRAEHPLRYQCSVHILDWFSQNHSPLCYCTAGIDIPFDHLRLEKFPAAFLRVFSCGRLAPRLNTPSLFIGQYLETFLEIKSFNTRCFT